MFGQNHVDVMPDYSNYELWDQYMGGLWHGLLTDTGLPVSATVIEVAPGATAKIPQALAHLNFSGRLYLVEPHLEAAGIVYRKATDLLPQADIVVLRDRFTEVRIEGKIDALVANHPFDDFLSAYGTPDEDNLATLFQDITRESVDVLSILRQTWQRLADEPERLAAIKQQVVTDWQAFTARHQPDRVILSQYASSYLDQNGLTIINSHAKDVFQRIYTRCVNPRPRPEIQQCLNRNENYRNTWIGEELLNANHWILDEKRRETQHTPCNP